MEQPGQVGAESKTFNFTRRPLRHRFYFTMEQPGQVGSTCDASEALL